MCFNKRHWYFNWPRKLTALVRSVQLSKAEEERATVFSSALQLQEAFKANAEQLR